MSNFSSTEEESNQLFENSILYLKQSLILSAKTQRRVGLRVRILIRGVMIGLVITLLSIFYLIYLLTNQVDSLSNSLDNMTTEAVAIRNSTEDIQIVLMSFQTQMNVMPALNYSVENISGDIVTISDNMNGITGNLSNVSTELTGMRSAMQGLSGNVTGLDQTLFRVERDINSSTKPFKRFNQMNPMNHLP